MRKITADRIYTMNGDAVENGVVVVNEEGTIVELLNRSECDPTEQEVHAGIITPGFVNTHCHLELSHMKGLVDTGTGLVPFISAVVQFRDFPEEQILDAIRAADQEMYDAGIVAVGDISNKLDTVGCKDESPISYYSFVEMFDFLKSDNAQHSFDGYKEVYDGQSEVGANKKMAVPHAPYTVSAKLFELINATNGGAKGTVSIHNQEMHDENLLFLKKEGGLVDFYQNIGMPLDHFAAKGGRSIDYAIDHMDPSHRHLFVHNTMTNAQDIQQAQSWCSEVYWCTCPNANLYIENRLPNYKTFIESGATMTIGTDSLTSNWQLSIIEEMKTIQRYQSFVSFEQLIQWATLNGAKALGYEDLYGSIEVGKQPGLNLIENVEIVDGKVHLQNAQVKRLVP